MAEVVKVTSVLFFDDDLTAKRILEKEAHKLKRIAQREWLRVLGEYKQKPYIARTAKSFKSIKKTEVRKVGFGWKIDVTFENSLAYHDSVVGGEKGHAIWLNHAGWRVKRGWHKDIRGFGYKDGSGYLFRVLKEYQAVKDPRVSLEITWNRSK